MTNLTNLTITSAMDRTIEARKLTHRQEVERLTRLLSALPSGASPRYMEELRERLATAERIAEHGN
jgi:hypothetical protein